MKTALAYVLWLAVVMFLAFAWIGVQVAFPLMPFFGRLARQLPDSMQMCSVFAIFNLSIVLIPYYVYELVIEHKRHRSAHPPH
jgi:hypothetical protein